MIFLQQNLVEQQLLCRLFYFALTQRESFEVWTDARRFAVWKVVVPSSLACQERAGHWLAAARMWPHPPGQTGTALVAARGFFITHEAHVHIHVLFSLVVSPPLPSKPSLSQRSDHILTTSGCRVKQLLFVSLLKYNLNRAKIKRWESPVCRKCLVRRLYCLLWRREVFFNTTGVSITRRSRSCEFCSF